MREVFEENTIGSPVLFQAVIPLLEAAQARKFVPISTLVSSTGDVKQANFPTLGYDTFKAALIYLTMKIHIDYPNIIALPIHPGYVQQFVP